MGFPKLIQIEPTNSCNFNCVMCMRKFWGEESGYMDFSLYKKIAREVFPNVERVVFYGEGEPFMHPRFMDMLRICREVLPKDATILLLTNGSLLNERVIDEIVLDVGIDELFISLDIPSRMESIRLGSSAPLILRNLEYLKKMKKKKEFILGIEAIAMKGNLEDLPNINRIII